MGAQPWLGFQFMFLARELGLLSPELVRLIEMPSASASLRGLGAQALDGAGLTLDEVLTARSRGMDLRVVAVVDVSNGADAVVGRPAIVTPMDLSGMTIGVESTATGAVMLDGLLAKLGLHVADVTVMPMAIDAQVEAYREGRIDAAVTYEPFKSRMIELGAHVVFSSAEVPGRIIDTVAVRADVLARRADSVKALLQGHFGVLRRWHEDPNSLLAGLATRLGLKATQVPSAFGELLMPDESENQVWLADGAARLQQAAASLGQVMHRAGLLPAAPDVSNLADGRFLPKAG
jgi:NitT/TauT family transport system substrate-binding protein